MTKDELLKKLSAIDFYLIDLHLYLNNHPTDRDALMQYNTLVAEAKKNCGPNMSSNMACCLQIIQ